MTETQSADPRATDVDHGDAIRSAIAIRAVPVNTTRTCNAVADVYT